MLLNRIFELKNETKYILLQSTTHEKEFCNELFLSEKVIMNTNKLDMSDLI